MAYDWNSQRRRFGEIAQAANPQVSDPNQNRNLGGFPAGPKVNPGTAAVVAPPSVKAPRFSDSVASTVLPTPGMPLAPAVNPKAESAALKAIPDQHRDSSLAGGQYGGGGYTPIKEGEQWGGQGYAGPDPRDAAAPAAPAEAPAPPPPGAQGGKGGQVSKAATNAGFEPPAGAGGGKGGGAGVPSAGDSPALGNETPPPTAPPADRSNIVPAGDVGNTGIDPNNPIEYEDTGNYDEDTGFSAPFESQYKMQEGGAPGQIIVSQKNPEAQARQQRIADAAKQEWVAAGGDPNNFQAFNPVKGQYKHYIQNWDNLSGEERWQAQQDVRTKFYADQQAALTGARRPGVQ